MVQRSPPPGAYVNGPAMLAVVEMVTGPEKVTAESVLVNALRLPPARAVTTTVPVPLAAIHWRSYSMPLAPGTTSVTYAQVPRPLVETETGIVLAVLASSRSAT